MFVGWRVLTIRGVTPKSSASSTRHSASLDRSSRRPSRCPWRAYVHMERSIMLTHPAPLAYGYVRRALRRQQGRQHTKPSADGGGARSTQSRIHTHTPNEQQLPQRKRMKQNCNCKNRRHGTSPDTQVRESRFTEDNQCEQTEKNKVVFTDYVQEPPRHSSAPPPLRSSHVLAQSIPDTGSSEPDFSIRCGGATAPR